MAELHPAFEVHINRVLNQILLQCVPESKVDVFRPVFLSAACEGCKISAAELSANILYTPEYSIRLVSGEDIHSSRLDVSSENIITIVICGISGEHYSAFSDIARVLGVLVHDSVLENMYWMDQGSWPPLSNIGRQRLPKDLKDVEICDLIDEGFRTRFAAPKGTPNPMSERFQKIVHQYETIYTSTCPLIYFPPPHILVRMGVDDLIKQQSSGDLVSGAKSRHTRTKTRYILKPADRISLGSLISNQASAGHFLRAQQIDMLYSKSYVHLPKAEDRQLNQSIYPSCESELKTIMFYGEHDKSVAQFFDGLSKSLTDSCQQCAERDIISYNWQHLINVVHGEYKVVISLEGRKLPLESAKLWTWFSCDSCNSSSKPSSLSSVSSEYSVSKLFEQMLCNPYFGCEHIKKLCKKTCGHYNNNHQNRSVQLELFSCYYYWQNCLFKFATEKITLREIQTPCDRIIQTPLRNPLIFERGPSPLLGVRDGATNDISFFDAVSYAIDSDVVSSCTESLSSIFADCLDIHNTEYANSTSAADVAMKVKSLFDTGKYDAQFSNSEQQYTEEATIEQGRHVMYLRRPKSYVPGVRVRIRHPHLFHLLRKTYSIDEKHLLRSFKEFGEWSPVGGKSGASFWKSKDNHFVFKRLDDTISARINMLSHSDFLFQYLFYILFDRFPVVKNASKYSPTILTPILGLFDITIMRGSEETHASIMVMENLFCNVKTSTVYDLKGVVGRSVSSTQTGFFFRKRSLDNVAELQTQGDDVFHALGLANTSNSIFLVFLGHHIHNVKHNHARHLLIKSLEEDIAFLTANGIVDYSLLVGVGNQGNIVVGIVDYLTEYGILKMIEEKGKKSMNYIYDKLAYALGMKKVSTEVTIQSPNKYGKRMISALHAYFPIIPDKWSLSRPFDQ